MFFQFSTEFSKNYVLAYYFCVIGGRTILKEIDVLRKKINFISEKKDFEKFRLNFRNKIDTLLNHSSLFMVK